MALAEYQASRLLELERKPELTVAEKRLRDSMRVAEPEEARSIALKAAEEPARGAAQESAAGRADEPAERVRAAELRGALAEFGVTREDLDDALAMLDGAIPPDYDQAALDGAVTALQERRPELFRSRRPTAPRPSMSLPAGRPGVKGAPRPARFGAGGVEAARKRGWVMSDD